MDCAPRATGKCLLPTTVDCIATRPNTYPTSTGSASSSVVSTSEGNASGTVTCGAYSRPGLYVWENGYPGASRGMLYHVLYEG